MFTVHLNYFKSNGEQHVKVIERKTKKGLVNAIKRFDDNNDVFRVSSISFNLYDDKDFNDFISNIGWQ